MKKNQSGFSVVESVLVVAILGLIGGVGWYMWHKNHTNKSHASTSTSASISNTKQGPTATHSTPKTEPPKANTLSLAGDSVNFTLPTGWTYTKGNDQCQMFASANLTCIDGAAITPGVKLPTRYGNGTEFFDIQVSVYQNPKHDDAKTFLETDTQQGTGTGNIKTSSNPVNGYNSFYLWQQYDGDGTSVREINYSYSVKDMDVVVYARTYEPGTLDNGTKVGDFTQFEPAIADMAKSIKIN